jgi:hypothetical protein
MFRIHYQQKKLTIGASRESHPFEMINSMRPPPTPSPAAGGVRVMRPMFIHRRDEQPVPVAPPVSAPIMHQTTPIPEDDSQSSVPPEQPDPNFVPAIGETTTAHMLSEVRSILWGSASSNSASSTTVLSSLDALSETPPSPPNHSTSALILNVADTMTDAERLNVQDFHQLDPEMQRMLASFVNEGREVQRYQPHRAVTHFFQVQILSRLA